jgi:hypothetical protein
MTSCVLPPIPSSPIPRAAIRSMEFIILVTAEALKSVLREG